MRKRDEPVRLTRIYTRGGDAGETSLGDGERVPKTDARVEANGAVDELNSVLGLALAADLPVRFGRCSSGCRTSSSTSAPISLSRSVDGRRAAARCTVEVDRARASLRRGERPARAAEELRPAGRHARRPPASIIARTVCRRAEREALAVGDDANPLALVYLNRLSDLLFILARAANADRAARDALAARRSASGVAPLRSGRARRVVLPGHKGPSAASHRGAGGRRATRKMRRGDHQEPGADDEHGRVAQ